MKSNTQPVIRFSGFTDDWNEMELGELVVIRSGWSPSDFSQSKESDGEMYIKVDDLNRSQREQIDSKMKVVLHEKYSMMKKGSIIFPKRGAAIMTNKIRILGNDSYMDTNMMALETKRTNVDFLYTFIVRTGLFKIADTSTIPQINNKHIESYSIVLPTEEEQLQIGNFFKKLDEIISHQEQELTILKQTKQGFLQKMFPKEGEAVPEVRFPGFTDDWIKRKLDSIVDRVKSYSLSRDVETNENTGFKYIHYGDIHTGVATQIDESSDLPNIKPGNFELLKKGDLVLADASEDYQGIAKPSVITIDLSYKLVSGLHTIALRPTRVDSLFLYYLINASHFRRYGYKVGTGMKVFGISVSNLMKFEGMIPILEEQIQIGIFFKQLDEMIALHEQELEALQQTKKAFLQKMFV